MQEFDNTWRGYTLDEIRVRRLVNLTMIEIDQQRLNQFTQRYTNRASATTSSPIFRKLVGALDFVDYGVLAYKMGRMFFSIFRRKRR